jgi:hypothetical protein
MMTDQNITDEEERAWNEMERKQNKKWDTSDMAHRPNGLTVDVTDLINRAKAEEREACARLFDAEVWAYDYREIAAAIRGRTE